MIITDINDDDIVIREEVVYDGKNAGEVIKEVKNTPEKAVYQFGKGKDSLILSVVEKTEFHEVMSPTGDPMRFSEKHLKLELSRNNEAIYNLSELMDSEFSYYKGNERNRYPPVNWWYY